MPKKSKGMVHISERDMKAFRMLWCVEHVPIGLLDLSKTRIKTLQNIGYIDRCKNVKNDWIIKCTKKGRAFISKLPEFENRHAYVCSEAAAHNCKLADIFSSLSDEQQKNWKTERELAEMYREYMDELRQSDFRRWGMLVDKPWSPADGGIVSQTGTIERTFEVITRNYNSLEEKETFSEVISAPIEYYRIVL